MCSTSMQALTLRRGWAPLKGRSQVAAAAAAAVAGAWLPSRATDSSCTQTAAPSCMTTTVPTQRLWRQGESGSTVVWLVSGSCGSWECCIHSMICTTCCQICSVEVQQQQQQQHPQQHQQQQQQPTSCLHSSWQGGHNTQLCMGLDSS
jgi:hypothetical protein